MLARLGITICTLSLMLAACGSDPAVPAGASTRTITYDGMERTYDLYYPEGGAAQMALVVNLHGLLGDGPQQNMMTGMTALAEEQKFIVVAPTSLGTAGAAILSGGSTDPTAWNAGACCAFNAPDRDDLGFLVAVLDDIESTGVVDAKRIYVTGMSNGGFMSHRIACELSDRIAAVAPVAGVIGIPLESCNPSRAVPVIDIHGTADQLVPYEGGAPPLLSNPIAGQAAGALFPGGAPDFLSVQASVDFWVGNNGCSTTPMNTFEDGNASCSTYSSCTDGADVTLCTIQAGGHSWPGGTAYSITGTQLVDQFITGAPSRDLDASATIWAFFDAHPMP